MTCAQPSSHACSGAPPESSSTTVPLLPGCTDMLLVSPGMASTTTLPWVSCSTVAARAASAAASDSVSAAAAASMRIAFMTAAPSP